jgi:predicted nucleotidyltransferase
LGSRHAQQKVDELVKRIVDAVHPLRIYLFGSAARGAMHANSDLDVLVVMPDGIRRNRTTDIIYRNMSGFGMAKDILVVTESDVKAHRDNPYLIIKNALDEGKELYRAASRSPEEWLAQAVVDWAEPLVTGESAKD